MGKEWSDKQGGVKVYEPPLPTSVQKEPEWDGQLGKKELSEKAIYGKGLKENGYHQLRKNGEGTAYDPPLPTSVQKEPKKDVYDYQRRLANGELKDHRRPMGWRGGAHWEPSLPTSVQKEEKQKIRAGQIYNGGKEMDSAYTPSEKKAIYKMSGNNQCYQPPLPTSVQVESKNIYNNKEITHYAKRKGNESAYEPPLPTSVQKQGTIKPNVYSDIKGGMYRSAPGQWSPPLPTTVQRTETGEYKPYTVKDSTYGKDLKVTTNYKGRKGSESCYDPPLPTSVQSPECPELDEDDTFLLHANQEEHLPAESREDLIRRLINPDMETDYLNEEELPHSVLEIASQKGKHSTQKPLDLMKWALKYFSKEGDVVLDNTMGSGSTGVACKEMNRSFIGIEMNPDIFETACDRILD